MVKTLSDEELFHKKQYQFGSLHIPRRQTELPISSVCGDLTNTTCQAASYDQRGYRLTSIDMLRGLVLLIMALDHVRDFLIVSPHDPMADPNASPLLYLTRLITHFCAPVFVFLAGTSAGLMAARKSASVLGSFLFTRGLWLIFVEMTIVSIAWTFSPFGVAPMGGYTIILMLVIWAIGASMIVLAGVQFFGRSTCLYIGAVIIFGHNFLDPIWPKGGIGVTDIPLWAALHTGMSAIVGQFKFIFAYPLLPWTGVMLLGFGAASLFEQPPEQRKALLLKIGFFLTFMFVVTRVLGVYGDPHEWHYQPEKLAATTMGFFDTTKYPPSLQYLLMTLGPAAIICAYADQFKGWFKDTLVMFGRVPFTFYILHLYIAHAIGVMIGMYQGYTFAQMSTFFRHTPKEFGLGLAGVYAVWLLVIALLYPACRWLADVKARRKNWWLSYI